MDLADRPFQDRMKDLPHLVDRAELLRRSYRYRSLRSLPAHHLVPSSPHLKSLVLRFHWIRYAVAISWTYRSSCWICSYLGFTPRTDYSWLDSIRIKPNKEETLALLTSNVTKIATWLLWPNLTRAETLSADDFTRALDKLGQVRVSYR